jgi:hypothetical protein
VFAWRYLSAAGEEVGESPRFDDRVAAEAWLSTAWEELLDRDVDAVDLVDDAAGAAVYRMSLASSGGS